MFYVLPSTTLISSAQLCTVTHMLNLAKAFRESQVTSAQGEPTENSRRCMLLYWFMSQIMRALGLWHADRSLTVALEVAKAFAPCVEFMMMIWPSPGTRPDSARRTHVHRSVIR